MSAVVFTSDSVPRKTSAGSHALTVRDARMPPALRRLLLLTDGTRTVFTLSNLLPDVNIARALSELARLGLVEDRNASPATPRAAEEHAEDLPDGWMEASAFMMTRAKDNLGVAAAEVIDRIEQARSTESAREAMSVWYRAMRSSRNGRTMADADRVRVVELLGRV